MFTRDSLQKLDVFSEINPKNTVDEEFLKWAVIVNQLQSDADNYNWITSNFLFPTKNIEKLDRRNKVYQ